MFICSALLLSWYLEYNSGKPLTLDFHIIKTYENSEFSVLFILDFTL